MANHSTLADPQKWPEVVPGDLSEVQEMQHGERDECVQFPVRRFFVAMNTMALKLASVLITRLPFNPLGLFPLGHVSTLSTLKQPIPIFVPQPYRTQRGSHSIHPMRLEFIEQPTTKRVQSPDLVSPTGTSVRHPYFWIQGIRMRFVKASWRLIGYR